MGKIKTNFPTHTPTLPVPSFSSSYGERRGSAGRHTLSLFLAFFANKKEPSKLSDSLLSPYATRTL